MRVHQLEREQRLDRPPAEVFAFFADAVNLEALTPPLLRFEVMTPGPIAMAAGTRISYRLRLHGLPLRWLTEIEEWSPPDASSMPSCAGPTASGATPTGSRRSPAAGP